MESDSITIRCHECEASESTALVSPRPKLKAFACEACGSEKVSVVVSISDTIVAPVDILSVEVTPNDQAWDWNRRWQLIQIKADEITAIKTSASPLDEIYREASKLREFYVLAYHLKDFLKISPDLSSEAKDKVESVISSSETLALLADLANLDKHGFLSKPPRSDKVPKIGTMSAKELDSGWMLKVKIYHGTNTLDGVEFVERVVETWAHQLRQWGLLPS